MNKLHKTLSTLFILSFVGLPFCCSPKDPGPNIRIMPGIDYCAPACKKMTELYDSGDQSCLPYIEVIVVDDEEMNCIQFCEYEMNNSVQLNPKCIYEKIESCVEIPEKCED